MGLRPEQTFPIHAPISWATVQRRFGIGAKIVGHARFVAFQMVHVAISKNLFADQLWPPRRSHRPDGRLQA